MRKWHALIFAAALGACVVEPDETAVPDGDVQARTAALEPSPVPTTVTFFSEGFWGAQLAVQIPLVGDGRATRIVSTAQLRDASLLGRISTVRIACGTRKTSVILFNGDHTGTGMAGFNASARSEIFGCDPGQTRDVDLHASAAFLADKVRSAYVVSHAREMTWFPFSDLVRDTWEQELATGLGDGVTARGGPIVALVAENGFTVRQNLRLDHWSCRAQDAHFTIRANIYPGMRRFTVAVADVHVDTGFLDGIWCWRSMRDGLAAKAADVARRLAGVDEDGNGSIDGGIDLILGILGPRAEYYFVPTASRGDFDIFGGLASPAAPDPRPAPRPCRSNQRCCEPRGNGCDLCVPLDAECR